MTGEDNPRPALRSLCVVAIAAGFVIAILSVAVGLSSRLQMFGDGSIFSYMVAAQDAWSFHWHNISGRLFSYVFAYIPAEASVALTRNPDIGITVYGLLHFSAPLLGLLVTLAADRTTGRIVVVYACLSTASLCPLVFGAGTEMWMTHSVFWPALAICLCAPLSGRGTAAMFAGLLSLVFTHEGAIIFAGAILFALFLRGRRDARFVRALGAFCAVMTIWLIVKITIRPDDYIAGVLAAAAYKFIDIRNLAQPAFLTLVAALAAYGMTTMSLRRAGPQRAIIYAAFAVILGLAAYWIWFDRWILTEARYNLRTALLIMTPTFGVLAAIYSMTRDERSRSSLPLLAQIADAGAEFLNPRAFAGAIMLTLLVHGVETLKFVRAWADYKAAIRMLATGTESDPDLGSPLFVSSRRIGADLNRLSWNSTTPFLSVLVARGFEPTRLVVDPGAGYFWLSCDTAKQSERTSTALPLAGRRLIRIHACLHR